MTASVQRTTLDAPPAADRITTARQTAADQHVSVELHFPVGDHSKRLVVSPRGTVVLLNGVSEDTFHPSTSAQDIAGALSA
jgi:hypothetical protein